MHKARHTAGQRLLDATGNLKAVQKLLGHQDLRTTMIYTHVLRRGPLGVKSPLDSMDREGDG